MSDLCLATYEASPHACPQAQQPEPCAPDVGFVRVERVPRSQAPGCARSKASEGAGTGVPGGACVLGVWLCAHAEQGLGGPNRCVVGGARRASHGRPSAHRTRENAKLVKARAEGSRVSRREKETSASVETYVRSAPQYVRARPPPLRTHNARPIGDVIVCVRRRPMCSLDHTVTASRDPAVCVRLARCTSVDNPSLHGTSGKRRMDDVSSPVPVRARDRDTEDITANGVGDRDE